MKHPFGINNGWRTISIRHLERILSRLLDPGTYEVRPIHSLLEEIQEMRRHSIPFAYKPLAEKVSEHLDNREFELAYLKLLTLIDLVGADNLEVMRLRATYDFLKD